MTHAHRRSIRLRNYDYTQAGAYFVTVCTYDRARLFGGTINGARMVMPNHFHGVLMLNDCASAQRSFARDADSGTARRAPTDMGHAGHIETIEHFGRPVTGSLPTIMRAYESPRPSFAPGNAQWDKKASMHSLLVCSYYRNLDARCPTAGTARRAATQKAHDFRRGTACRAHRAHAFVIPCSTRILSA